MFEANQPETDHDSMTKAYGQIYRGSQTLLDIDTLSWFDKLLLSRVNSLSKRWLDQAGKDTTTGEIDSGDRITVGKITAAENIAIGRGATVESWQGKDLRDAQYEIARHWDGRRLMRGFDLSGRDLSGLNLANADLRNTNLTAADLRKTNLAKANLGETDLTDTNLKGADLSEANLQRATYSANTRWPDDFQPQEAGAVLVNDEGSSP